MVKNVGIVGFSEGNGHPFSFSALINGFNYDRFSSAGWDVIRNYMECRDVSEFGFGESRVTHCWSDDKVQSDVLAYACDIAHVCDSYEQLIENVSCVIIARDDWECHHSLAMKALNAGKFVFLDKPLTVNLEELHDLLPFLQNGKLMSNAGLRFARELDPMRVRDSHKPTGQVKLYACSILNGLDAYGIHMLDAISSITPISDRRVDITRHNMAYDSFSMRLVKQGADDLNIRLDCLGNTSKTFNFDIYGKEANFHAQLFDNFSAFRRTLWRFFKMVETGKPQINPEETRKIIEIIVAARNLKVDETTTVS